LANDVNDANVQNNIKVISDLYATIQSQVGEAKKVISEQIMQTNILNTMVEFSDKVKEQCPNVIKWVRVASLLVLILLALCSLFFIIGWCNTCFRSISTLVGYIMFNVLIVFGIFSFLVLIGGSDFCLYSKPVVQKYANSMLQRETVGQDMLSYYLYCNKSEHNQTKNTRDIHLFDLASIAHLPAVHLNTDSNSIEDLFGDVQDYINKAQNYTHELNDTIGLIESNIEEMCKTVLRSSGIKESNIDKICSDLKEQVSSISNKLTGTNALITRMTTLLDSVRDIVGEVECKQITELINQTFSTLCTNVYEAFFFFLINSLVATFCFYLMLILSIWLLF